MKNVIVRMKNISHVYIIIIKISKFFRNFMNCSSQPKIKPFSSSICGIESIDIVLNILSLLKINPK